MNSKIVAIYLAISLVHYVFAHLYVRMCTPSGIYGFFQSLVLNDTLHCKAIRYTIQNTSNTMTNMAISLGAWLVLKYNEWIKTQY